MSFSKPFGPSASETSEVGVEIEGDVRERARGSAVFGRSKNGDSEMSVTGLGRLLRRVSGISKSEIDTLIGQLQTLRDRLLTDGERLQNDISEYVSLGQQVMELTKVVSENVRKLPDAQEPSR
jgi:hypothetical protein